MARKLTAAEIRRWERYFNFRDQGMSVTQAAARSRLPEATAYRFERGDQGSSGLEAASYLGRETVGGLIVAKPLSEDALRALEEFAYFRMRYFGRKSEPWQERAAYDVLRAVQSNQREYVVINAPPGSGKSTLFTNDIPCWLIVRDRTIRIMVGSRTERQARQYVGRIKRALEREAPLLASADDLDSGRSFDAIATLQDDFGAFRPEGRSELWRAEALVVRQLDGVSLDDKEPTVSAWGQDSGFLGGRFDLVVWDDLADRKNTRTLESIQSSREWWTTEAETRVEPGGALILQGQRIAHNDLYRFCLDMRNLDDTPKYRHIVYAAHDEDRCTGHDDGATEQPWPSGCLLDPFRLPWSMLETIKHNSPRTYEVQYQQRDGDLVAGLVEEAWIKGGVDSHGFPAPGCLDRERAIDDPPPNLTDGRGWSYVTVDPSPTEWWGVIWWLYDPASGNRYVIDIVRRRMNPEDFLSINMDTFEFDGLMEQMRRRANLLRIPIQTVVVEINAAQRWLLAQPHVQRWMDATGVTFVGHSTYTNKADPKFGLESIGDLFRQGRIRLPYSTPSARAKVADLVTEAMAYPDGETTDLLMSAWFGKLAVEQHYVPRQGRGYGFRRPSWMAGSQRGLAYVR